VFGTTTDKDIITEVNSKLSQLVELMKDPYAVEYENARGIAVARRPAGEPGTEGLVVAVSIFTIEGFAHGNSYSQFMAVFANLGEEIEELKDHPQRLSLLDFKEVGGKGLRGVEFDKIKLTSGKHGEFVITVPALEYGKRDPMCCPSIKSTMRYSIKPEVGGRLTEIKKRPNK
jgi:hypothetical protein